LASLHSRHRPSTPHPWKLPLLICPLPNSACWRSCNFSLTIKQDAKGIYHLEKKSLDSSAARLLLHTILAIQEPGTECLTLQPAFDCLGAALAIGLVQDLALFHESAVPIATMLRWSPCLTPWSRMRPRRSDITDAVLQLCLVSHGVVSIYFDLQVFHCLSCRGRAPTMT